MFIPTVHCSCILLSVVLPENLKDKCDIFCTFVIVFCYTISIFPNDIYALSTVFEIFMFIPVLLYSTVFISALNAVCLTTCVEIWLKVTDNAAGQLWLFFCSDVILVIVYVNESCAQEQEQELK